MDWTYLDEVNKNLLYIYAQTLAKSEKMYLKGLFDKKKSDDKERNEFDSAESKRKNSYYLLWFVYRYVLNCKTLDEALAYANEETLNEYKLSLLFAQRLIYIGVYGQGEIYLYKPQEGDLKIVLEILYKRYNFFEQLDCYIERTAGTTRTTRNRCIRLKKEYQRMLQESQEKH